MKRDINVTPLVDVVLVLLIILLVTMPVLMRTVTLEVPYWKEVCYWGNEPPADAIVVTYRPDGTVVLSEGTSSEHRTFGALELAARLLPMLESRHGRGPKVVYVDFCAATPWRDVVSTMDRIRMLSDDPSYNGIQIALKKRDKKSEMVPDLCLG